MTTFLDKSAQQAPNNTEISPASRNTKRLQQRQALLITGGRILLLICMIVVWQLVSGPLVDPLFISSPLAVALQISAWIGDGTLWLHTWVTLQETLLGLFFGTISGILVGFFFGIQPML